MYFQFYINIHKFIIYDKFESLIFKIAKRIVASSSQWTQKSLGRVSSQDALPIGSCSAVDCCPTPGSTSTERLIFGFPLPISVMGPTKAWCPLGIRKSDSQENDPPVQRGRMVISQKQRGKIHGLMRRSWCMGNVNVDETNFNQRRFTWRRAHTPKRKESVKGLSSLISPIY